MVEETAHPGQHVYRDELMHCGGRQARGHDLGRSHGAGRHQESQVRAFLGHAADQFEQGQRFTHGCGVKPDKIALRSLQTGNAAPLANTFGVFLACLQSGRKLSLGKPRGAGREGQVGGQGE